MGEALKDPTKLILRRSSLPMSLLAEPKTEARMHILETETFESTFGPKKQRKKPKISFSDVDELAKKALEGSEAYLAGTDRNIPLEIGYKDARRADVFDKGTSKRIWGELYKVIDASDVVIQVLDARDPMGTRCFHIEKQIKKDRAHKNIILVLNKCDLIPTWATARWVKILSKEFPTIAFHASITNPFGKGSLIQLLRQLSKLHSDKKQISVGLIGYPNVGKSSIINTLRAKKVCKVAPIPGETKVWQYVTFMKKIYLVDCPGIVYPSGDTETDIVLKGVVRIENIGDAQNHIPAILNRVKKEYISKTYNIASWEDDEDFLTQFAKRSGRLLKGGEPDLNTCAKMVLHDWQRGKIPYFVCPPFLDDNTAAASSEPHNEELGVTQIFSNIQVENEYKSEPAPVPEEAEVVDWDEVYKNKGESDDEDDKDSQVENQVENDVQVENQVENEDESEDEEESGKFVRALNDDEAEDSEDSELDDEDLIDESEFGGKLSEFSDQRELNKLSKDEIAQELFKLDKKSKMNARLRRRKKLLQDLLAKAGGSLTVKPKQRMTTNKQKVGSDFYAKTNVKNRASRRPRDGLNNSKKEKRRTPKKKHQVLKTKDIGQVIYH
eukprot:TRINITY_DN1374_c0_g1_i1.p1 TRINITY_DN1374_c0_g1~~TRINITY_DN1374_c0_g1_i1.p1  ORF type:complete len:713 (+),score=275.57 TRINITY_DN1374_c0_g1_i1:307-2139(+)